VHPITDRPVITDQRENTIKHIASREPGKPPFPPTLSRKRPAVNPAARLRFRAKENHHDSSARQSKPVFLKNKSGESDSKGVWIGGDHPVAVQSMTTTDTADYEKTLEQVYGLAMEGCEIVRVTCQDPRDAAGLPHIVKRSPVPIVADIHFDHRMALAALDAGVAKLRLNPGNITDPAKTREVVKLAIERGTPIRIGVNMGSLARDLEEKLGHTPRRWSSRRCATSTSSKTSATRTS